MARFRPEISDPRRSAFRSLARSHSVRSSVHPVIVACDRSVSMNDASESLQDRKAALCKCNPDRSAKLMLQFSKEAFDSTVRLESVLVKVERSKRAPRKLHSTAL